MMPNVLEKLVILCMKSENLIGKDNYKIIKKLKQEIDTFLNKDLIIII